MTVQLKRKKTKEYTEEEVEEEKEKEKKISKRKKKKRKKKRKKKKKKRKKKKEKKKRKKYKNRRIRRLYIKEEEGIFFYILYIQRRRRRRRRRTTTTTKSRKKHRKTSPPHTTIEAARRQQSQHTGPQQHQKAKTSSKAPLKPGVKESKSGRKSKQLAIYNTPRQQLTSSVRKTAEDTDTRTHLLYGSVQKRHLRSPEMPERTQTHTGLRGMKQTTERQDAHNASSVIVPSTDHRHNSLTHARAQAPMIKFPGFSSDNTPATTTTAATAAAFL